MKSTDILREASAVVSRCLELIEIKVEVQELLTQRGSKFMCRCPNCRRQLSTTWDWLAAMRAIAVGETPAQPVANTSVLVHSK